MITIALAIIIFVVSLQGFNNIAFFERYKHDPYRVFRYKEYHRLLTSGFLHGSWVHLLINLFVFWQFGRFVEEYIFLASFGQVTGSVMYLLLFVLSVIVGNIPGTFKHRNNPYFGSIGASGAVSAILFSYVLLNPWGKIYLYAIIPIYTVVAALLYLGYSHWASRNSKDNIDHSAHFYGALFGFVYTILVNPRILGYFMERLTIDFPL
jgi:membrane associated rhomboid family serine protease